DVALNVGASDDYIRVPVARWIELAREHARVTADGFFLSCTNTTQIEAIETIERETGKPAVNSNQATLWAALRRAPASGAMPRIPGLGRLFAQAEAAAAQRMFWSCGVASSPPQPKSDVSDSGHVNEWPTSGIPEVGCEGPCETFNMLRPHPEEGARRCVRPSRRMAASPNLLPSFETKSSRQRPTGFLLRMRTDCAE